MPLVGLQSFNLPDISAADYIERVDFAGHKLHPGKRGKIEASEPKALKNLGLNKKTLEDALEALDRATGVWWVNGWSSSQKRPRVTPIFNGSASEKRQPTHPRFDIFHPATCAVPKSSSERHKPKLLYVTD